MKQKRSLRRDRSPSRMLVTAVMTFFFSAFLLLALKDLNLQSVLMAIAVPAIVFVGVMGLPKLLPADKLLLSLTNFLCALGVLLLFRLDPERGMAQAMNYGVGVFCMLVCIVLVRRVRDWKILAPIIALGALAMLALPLLFGEVKKGAKAWVSIAGVGMQPSEVVKLALLVVVAWLLSRRQVVLTALFAGACLLMLMLQKDLGTALLYYGTTLVMVFAATGSLLLCGVGVAGGAAAAVVGYTLFDHVQKRVRIWLNPWNDPAGEGYQIVMSLIAMANGGIWGTGLGVGDATNIPEYATDFIFAALFNEFGVVFALLVLLIYMALMLRGIGIALRSRTAFHSLLALGCVALLCLQTFVIIGGNIKLIPLTGVTLPFISYGGTSLVSSLCVIGLLQGVGSLNDDAVREDKKLAALGDEA